MAPSRKRQRISDDEATTKSLPVEGADANGDIVTTKQEQPQLRRQLFVRSLPATATSESLTAHFSASYPLKHATVVLDPTTKQSRGYAFVTFADAEDAQQAKEEFDGSVFEGRKIKVENAEPRHRNDDAGEGADGQPKRAPHKGAVAKAEREKKMSEARPPKLIIRNLPWSIKEPEQLADLFRSYGKVKHTTIPKKKPGLMPGFGFVVMRGRKNAERALEAVNGKEVDGRTLAVDWAVEKEVWQELQGQESTNTGVKPPATNDADHDPEDDNMDAPSEGDENEGDAADEALSDADSNIGSEDDLIDDDVEEDGQYPKPQDEHPTLFIRNLPFSATDESLHDHFSQFGPIRYARVVLDQVTERPKGTGFVCFYNPPDLEACLRGAPGSRIASAKGAAKNGDVATHMLKHSVLENNLADDSGRYTLDGRVLQVSRAVNRSEAIKLTEEGHSHRDRRDRDKRRLYLLSEGTVASNSPIYDTLAPSEIKIREASAKQRKSLIQSNPSLHLSLTRLSIRNIPRFINSKDLKALAREAVVGFAKDVKEGKRLHLSKEEENRGGPEMKVAEKARKSKGKGIVRQAKVVFEGREGGKVSEESGAGRSRGYGFIEYTSHRWALMGLRWLNGRAVGAKPRDNAKPIPRTDADDRKKRLIVEFAIENAQVVARRKENEEKARERSKVVVEKINNGEAPPPKKLMSKDTLMAKTRKGAKRKREEASAGTPDGRQVKKLMGISSQSGGQIGDANGIAQASHIIGKKRRQKKFGKGGAGRPTPKS